MKVKSFVTLLTIVVMGLAAMTVYAGLHFQGSGGFGSGSVLIEIDIAGIAGSRTAQVTATITGQDLEAVCRNRGGNIAYGQNPVDLSGISADQTLRADRNGRATANFRIDLIKEAGITGDVAGCPNRNWRVTDLLGTITINLFATDGSFSDSQNYTCTVREIDQFIACTQL